VVEKWDDSHDFERKKKQNKSVGGILLRLGRSRGRGFVVVVVFRRHVFFFIVSRVDDD
tara:strand:+ start:513 stop:686 length:174 start_codon:yes stop_codon:yes gene_type:complete